MRIYACKGRLIVEKTYFTPEIDVLAAFTRTFTPKRTFRRRYGRAHLAVAGSSASTIVITGSAGIA